jgi:peptide/nickel transport system substrate-binding protein
MAGPYMLKSWGGSNEIDLVRNPNYWGPKPKIEEVRFETVPDPSTGVAQVKTGQLDMYPQVPFGLKDQINGNAAASVIQAYGSIGLSPNNQKSPFNELGVRRAIDLAVDRNAINKVAFAGLATPQRGFWPPGMTELAPVDVPAPDVDAAKQALRGTSCEDGCTVTLMHNSYFPYLSQIAAVVQQNLKAIGINLKVQSVEINTFYNKIGAGEHQIAISGQYDYLPIPTGFLSYELQYDSGASNFSFYKSAEMDRLVEAVFKDTGAPRADAESSIEDLYAEDVPMITLANYPIMTAVRASLTSATYARPATVEVDRESDFPDPAWVPGQA